MSKRIALKARAAFFFLLTVILGLSALVAGLRMIGDNIAVDKSAQSRRNWIAERHYAPRVEQGLTKLAGVRPELAAYVRENGIPINITDDDRQYEKNCGRGTLACTSKRSHVYIKPATAMDIDLVAAVIAHEVVHVQHGDPAHPFSRHSGLRHWAWRSEENEAHLVGIYALFDLHRADLWPRWIDFPLHFSPWLCFGFFAALTILSFRAYDRATPATRPRRTAPEPLKRSA